MWRNYQTNPLVEITSRNATKCELKLLQVRFQTLHKHPQTASRVPIRRDAMRAMIYGLHN